MKPNPINELDERIAAISLWIITISVYFAITENLMNNAPLSLVISNTFIALFLSVLSVTHLKWRKNKRIIRWLFIGFCFILFPIVWLTSKGAMGAQPIYMAFFIVLATLILEPAWSLFLSISTVMIVTLLMLMEYFGIITFSYIPSIQELLLSNLIHYIIVYTMFIAVGLSYKVNYAKYQKEFYRLSIIDDLTQLNTRHYLIRVLGQLISESQRHQQPFSVLFIDIDNFKLVNDHDGHQVGDQVLTLLGQIINEGLREYDTGGRYGGDEIMVLLPHTSIQDARVIAKRVSDAFETGVKNITLQPVSLSIGIVDSQHKTLEDIIRVADEAMYQMKKNKDTTSL